MAFTAEQIRDAWHKFVDDYDGSISMDKVELRNLMTKAGTWLDAKVTEVRGLLDVQAPALSAKLTDADLKKVIKKAVEVW
jgi:hypothetical protein